MKSNGFATILLMIPVLAVPALAIFGIPQFAPVVASPLDEGSEKDREYHVGNSATTSRDEMFTDFDDFGSEPAPRDEPMSKRRGFGSHDRGATQASAESAPSWGDDLAVESDWLAKSRRRTPTSAAVKEPEMAAQLDAQAANKRPKKSLLLEKSSRKGRRDSFDAQSDDPVRLASNADVEPGVLQAGFADSNVEPKPSSTARNALSGGAREFSRKREAVAEPLTWSVVQTRLNEFEIHNFRLEPGHQLGQFLFSCSYTPPENPRVSYKFEACSEEPLKAVEKVLEQIVTWRQHR